MAENERQVLVSRPTFAELANALAKSGHQDLFNEDGNIDLGCVLFHTEDDVPQPARLAAAIADAATHTTYQNGDPVYEDGSVTITSKCRHDGVHLMEHHPDRDPAVVVVPRQALHLVASDLIECMGRPVE